MTDLADGETFEMQGSGSKPYVLKNVGGVYSCSCPAWRNQSAGPERRSCKHLKKLRGEAAEALRVGDAAAAAPAVKRVREPAVPGDSLAEAEASAPPLLLAHVWDSEALLAGWWMSEKLDGVRAYWDGQRFVSRLGNQYYAPPWFTAGLPKFPLDG